MLEVLNAERKEGSIEKRQAMIRGRLEERRKETDSLINPSSQSRHLFLQSAYIPF